MNRREKEEPTRKSMIYSKMREIERKPRYYSIIEARIVIHCKKMRCGGNPVAQRVKPTPQF